MDRRTHAQTEELGCRRSLTEDGLFKMRLVAENGQTLKCEPELLKPEPAEKQATMSAEKPVKLAALLRNPS